MGLHHDGAGPSDKDVERLPARFPSIPDDKITEENEEQVIFYEQLRTETFLVAEKILNYVTHSEEMVMAIMNLSNALVHARKAILDE